MYGVLCSSCDVERSQGTQASSAESLHRPADFLPQKVSTHMCLSPRKPEFLNYQPSPRVREEISRVHSGRCEKVCPGKGPGFHSSLRTSRRIRRCRRARVSFQGGVYTISFCQYDKHRIIHYQQIYNWFKNTVGRTRRKLEGRPRSAKKAAEKGERY